LPGAEPGGPDDGWQSDDPGAPTTTAKLLIGQSTDRSALEGRLDGQASKGGGPKDRDRCDRGRQCASSDGSRAVPPALVSVRNRSPPAPISPTVSIGARSPVAEAIVIVGLPPAPVGPADPAHVLYVGRKFLRRSRQTAHRLGRRRVRDANRAARRSGNDEGYLNILMGESSVSCCLLLAVGSLTGSHNWTVGKLKSAFMSR
jgi:hypothetical protein